MVKKKAAEKVDTNKQTIQNLSREIETWKRLWREADALTAEVRLQGEREKSFALLRQENEILKAQNEYFRNLAEDLIFSEDEEEGSCEC